LLVMVSVKLVVPLSGIVAAPNALVTLGGVATLRLAFPVFPVPPFVELTLPVVLFFVPAVVPVTLRETVQLLLTAMLAPVSETLPEPATAVAVPPQVLDSPFGVETTSPAGKLSVKATPASATVFTAGFVIVNVKLVVPFRGTFVAPKAFAIEGGATTSTMAVLLVVPVPPSVELIAPVVLLLVPAVVPVTLTLMLQDPLADTLAPLRLKLPLPPTAPLTVPPQVLTRPGETDTASPDGNVSLNPTPLSADAFGLLIVKVSEVEPLSGMLAAPNALLMVGGPTTVRLAVLLVAPAPVSVELMAPVVLGLLPAVVPVTFTLIEHEPPDVRVPLLRLMLLLAAVAVTVPLQVSLSPLGVATTKPAGRVSLKLTPVRPNPALGLLRVKVKLVVPFSGMLAAPNALLIVGGLATVRVAVLLATPVPPLVEVIAPVVLSLVPEVVPLTSTLIVHWPLAARVPLARLIVLVPATAVTVPPHTPTTLGAAATCTPAGNGSLKATPLSAVEVFGLLRVKVMVEVPFTPIVVGENALLMVGGATTVTLSLLQALFVSAVPATLSSVTLLLGSTAQEPPVGLV
jgi:hypothetical protein